jgi:hypothetical protein
MTWMRVTRRSLLLVFCLAAANVPECSADSADDGKDASKSE